MRDAFIRKLTYLAEKDTKIMLLTGDLGFGVLQNFAQNFPNQFINCGVSEQNMTTVACGLALEGFNVYTYSIANFNSLRCVEQIRNDICYHDANVTIVSVGSGFSYGQLGMSHFATEDISIMRSIPNLKIFSPSDDWETEILTQKIYEINGPKYLRLDKSNAGLPKKTEIQKIGKAKTVINGNDFTIMVVGGIAKEALIAVEELKKIGINCRLVIFNCIKPLDKPAIINATQETKGILTLEEHNITGGFGSAIAEVFSGESIFPKFFKSLGVQDEIISMVGTQTFLREKNKLTARYIRDIVKNII